MIQRLIKVLKTIAFLIAVLIVFYPTIVIWIVTGSTVIQDYFEKELEKIW